MEWSSCIALVEQTGCPVLFSLWSYVTVKLLVIFKTHAIHPHLLPQINKHEGKSVLPFTVALSTGLALGELKGATAPCRRLPLAGPALALTRIMSATVFLNFFTHESSALASASQKRLQTTPQPSHPHAKDGLDKS